MKNTTKINLILDIDQSTNIANNRDIMVNEFLLSAVVFATFVKMELFSKSRTNKFVISVVHCRQIATIEPAFHIFNGLWYAFVILMFICLPLNWLQYALKTWIEFPHLLWMFIGCFFSCHIRHGKPVWIYSWSFSFGCYFSLFTDTAARKTHICIDAVYWESSTR